MKTAHCRGFFNAMTGVAVVLLGRVAKAFQSQISQNPQEIQANPVGSLEVSLGPVQSNSPLQWTPVAHGLRGFGFRRVVKELLRSLALIATLMAVTGCYGRSSPTTCHAKHIRDGRGGGPKNYDRCLAQYHCRIGQGPCPTKRSVWSVAIPVAIGVAVARNSQPQPQPRVNPTYAPTYYVPPTYVAPTQTKPLDFYCYKIGTVTQCRVTGGR